MLLKCNFIVVCWDFSFSVCIWGHTESLFEFLVKITAVFITDMDYDLSNGGVRSLQKVASNRKSLVHEKLLEAFAKMLTYPAAEIRGRESQHLRTLRQCCGAV